MFSWQHWRELLKKEKSVFIPLSNLHPVSDRMSAFSVLKQAQEEWQVPAEKYVTGDKQTQSQ